MYLSEAVQNKWAPVLDHPDLGTITDPYKRAVTAVVLENQERALREEAGVLNEATLNVGAGGGFTGASGAPTAGFDPILISLVRRSLPNLVAYDICGVQPMTGPTGLIFAMRSKYSPAGGSNTALYSEALYQEANTAHSGDITNSANGGKDLSSTNPGLIGFSLSNVATAMLTTTAENLQAGTDMNAMGFSIEKVTVTAKSRALQASYTLELAQDLKAVHGLDAETELANILSTEILAEINREVVRSVYAVAVCGANTANVPGVFNMGTNTITAGGSVPYAGDTDGRWAVEKYKGLLFQIEKEANRIAKDTRRGKGNMVLVSTDVASALAMTGLLDYQGALTNNTNLTVDDTGNTFAGTLFGRVKVFVDPYSVAGTDYVVVGYKGGVAYDAGLFYCPYVPLQMVRAIDPNTFQPKIGFKTRYGMVMNPFARGATTFDGALTANSNVYYRKFAVTNLR